MFCYRPTSPLLLFHFSIYGHFFFPSFAATFPILKSHCQSPLADRRSATWRVACTPPEYASRLPECLSTPEVPLMPTTVITPGSFRLVCHHKWPLVSLHHHSSQPLMAAADFTVCPPAIFLMMPLSNTVTQSSEEPSNPTPSSLHKSVCCTHSFFNVLTACPC